MTNEYSPHTNDGHIQSTPYPGSFATQRGASNGTALDKTGTTALVDNAWYTFFNGFGRLYRSFLVFDTSNLVGLTIVSAKIQLHFTEKENFGADDTNSTIVITESTQDSPTDLTTSDFNNFGTTELGKRRIADLNIGSYTDFELNSAGIAHINKTGYTKFCLMEGHDFANDTTTISGFNGYNWSQRKGGTIATQNNSNSGYRPKLIVTVSSVTNNNAIFPLLCRK